MTLTDHKLSKRKLSRRIAETPFQPFAIILRNGEFLLVRSPEYIIGHSANHFVAVSREQDECSVDYVDVSQLVPANADSVIGYADSILPGIPTRKGRDPRWLAIILVGEFVETDPEPIWPFIGKWGRDRQRDLRDAIATCLLEHLLEHHFAAYFPRVEEAARTSANFADTFLRCWKFGQSNARGNSQRYNRLVRQIELKREQRRTSG